MSEFPRDGGPNSFAEMWRGLRKRKEKLTLRNIQIKDLSHRLRAKDERIKELEEAYKQTVTISQQAQDRLTKLEKVREAAKSGRTSMCNTAQLIRGWFHDDSWSEWDKTTYEAHIEFQKRIEKSLAALGEESGEKAK